VIMSGRFGERAFMILYRNYLSEIVFQKNCQF